MGGVLLERDAARQGQFERERAEFEREREQMMGLKPMAPAAPAVQTSQTELGKWLHSLNAAEYEGAFREQQFETVAEIVEARCFGCVRVD
jgi:hypothetical protein